MSGGVTVIVPVDDYGPWVGDLVHSLDEQSLPVAAFDVQFVVSDPAGRGGQRLHDLARRRPNVRVDTAVATDSSADWIVHLGTGLAELQPTLFPVALERLAAFGERGGCDVVIGRTVYGAGLVADDFLLEDRVVDGPVRPEQPAPLPVACRATSDAARVLVSGNWSLNELTAGRRVGLLGGYPCLHVSVDADAAPGPGLSLGQCRAEWLDGRIVLTVEGFVAGAPADATVALAVHHLGTRESYWLSTREAAITADRLRAVGEVDVRTAASGAMLARGVWAVTVGLHASGWGRSAHQRIPPMPLPAGIVAGTPVVPSAIEQGLALDVGATRAPLLTALAADQVSISESVRGTKLTAALDDLVVDGRVRLRGRMVLGGFRLPADIVADAGSARLECLLSGLPGSAPVSTHFGGAPPSATGLTLTIDSVGQMSVAPTPPRPAPANRDKPSAAVTADQRKRLAARRQRRRLARSPVSRLRRKVPRWLEPTVQLLSRSSLAKRVYGSVVRRTAPSPKR